MTYKDYSRDKQSRRNSTYYKQTVEGEHYAQSKEFLWLWDSEQMDVNPREDKYSGLLNAHAWAKSEI